MKYTELITFAKQGKAQRKSRYIKYPKTLGIKNKAMDFGWAQPKKTSPHLQSVIMPNTPQKGRQEMRFKSYS